MVFSFFLLLSLPTLSLSLLFLVTVGKESEGKERKEESRIQRLLAAKKEEKKSNHGSGCNVRTQDPENFDEEVKSLVTAW